MRSRPSPRSSPRRAGRGREPRRLEGEGPNRAQPAPLRVLHAAAELFPWVKTGGLGDVMAGLPPALIDCGVDARMALPGFAGFVDAFDLGQSIRLRTPFAVERVRIARALVPGSGITVCTLPLPKLRVPISRAR